MIKDRQIENLLNNFSEKHSVTPEEVEEVVDSCYEFIVLTTSKFNFPEMTLEEFDNTKKNFNMPKLFKLYANRRKFKFLNNYYETKTNR